MRSEYYVILTYKENRFSQQYFQFAERTRCIVGRGEECEVICIPKDVSTVSRHHCELDINPPEVVIRDLGSLNGTFINDEQIGQRLLGETPEQGRARQYGDYPLRDGDVVRLGTGVTLQVKITGAKQDYATQPAQALGARQMYHEGAREKEQKDKAALGKQARKLVLNVLSQEDYELEEKPIGGGAMGVVLRGVEKASSKLVAVKLLNPNELLDSDVRRRHVQEALLMSRMKHDNIVGLHGVLFDGDLMCIVMDYCNGGSLTNWINTRRGGWPDPRRAVMVVLDALTGLEHAHQKKIIHRDIKPGNLLMHFDEKRQVFVPKLADFGLSKALDESGMTVTGSTAGTFEFMPRQQVMKFKYAELDVDVWAMGAVLYWLLTEGKTPRDFDPTQPKPTQVLTKSPLPIRERRSSVPAPLAELVDLALTDKPCIGIGTAKELRQRLEKVLPKL